MDCTHSPVIAVIVGWAILSLINRALQRAKLRAAEIAAEVPREVRPPKAAAPRAIDAQLLATGRRAVEVRESPVERQWDVPALVFASRIREEARKEVREEVREDVRDEVADETGDATGALDATDAEQIRRWVPRPVSPPGSGALPPNEARERLLLLLRNAPVIDAVFGPPRSGLTRERRVPGFRRR